MIPDPRRLLHLGGMCLRATAALCVLYRLMGAEVGRGERVDDGTIADVADLALCTEQAGDALQQLAQDAELLALLPHRARFPDLARMAEAMDRGVVFVPATVVSPGSVVVVPEHDPAAQRASLRERVGSRLARLKQRAG